MIISPRCVGVAFDRISAVISTGDWRDQEELKPPSEYTSLPDNAEVIWGNRIKSIQNSLI